MRLQNHALLQELLQRRVWARLNLWILITEELVRPCLLHATWTACIRTEWPMVMMHKLEFCNSLASGDTWPGRLLSEICWMKHRSPTSGAVGLLYPCGRIFISNISNSTKQRNCWGSIRRFDTISSYVPMYQREIMSRDCHVTTRGTVRSCDRCRCHVHCLIRLLTSRSLVSKIIYKAFSYLSIKQ